MTIAPVKVFSAATIASGASTSGSLDLKKVYRNISVQVGSMSTGVFCQLQASPDSGTTYYNVYQYVASSTTQANQVGIPAAFSNGGIIQFGPGLVPYDRIRFVGTAVVSGGISFVVIASD
jgi:hypothetical protein